MAPDLMMSEKSFPTWEATDTSIKYPRRCFLDRLNGSLPPEGLGLPLRGERRRGGKEVATHHAL